MDGSSEKVAVPEKTHFSVLISCRIGNEQYRPSICYPLSKRLQPTILSMEAKGKARTYTEKVRFVSGVAKPAKGSV